MVYAQERNIALKAVREAARLCATVRADMVGVDALDKSDRSPVTIADYGSQALVCKHLMSNFPDDSVVAEEDSTNLQRADNASKLSQVTHYVRRFQDVVTPRQVCEWIDHGNGSVAERFWALDPIDGTKGFLRNDQYAIALALVENHQVQVGALACPALPFAPFNSESVTGVLFIAVRGEGATMAPLDGGPHLPIRVADSTNKNTTRFVESVEPAHGNHALHQAIARAVGIVRPSLRMDSQAKYGAVARGDAALYLRFPSANNPDYRENIWDHAAGALIVEEAGGMVTDMYGRPLDFASDLKMRNNQGVVASNGKTHSKVLEALLSLGFGNIRLRDGLAEKPD